MFGRKFGCFIALGLTLGFGGTLHAQQPASADLQARIERLEKQNQDLLQRLQSLPTSPAIGQDIPGSAFSQGGSPVASQGPAGTNLGQKEVQKIVQDYLQQAEAAKQEQAAAASAAAAPIEGEDYRIGSNLRMSANWKNGLWLTTPNNDFTMHLGGWMQYDNTFWDQTPGLRNAPGARPGKAQGVASGALLGGIGDLQDGTYFRRIRPMVEGTFWENGEYTLILALENNQFSAAGLDEFWVGVKNIPVIGSLRLGHVKTPMGLEGDMTASSRTMTFMERSSYSEAIELNQNFVTGLWLGNAFLDQRTTYSFAAFRPDLGASTGTFFGDGQWGMQGRLTCLPIFQADGRHLLHLGLSGGWRNGTNNLAVSPFRTFQLRARPELRDDDPAASPGGAQIVPNSNSNRMIDTGVIAASTQWLTGMELLYILGPLSVQAEYGFNFLEDATGFAPAGTVLNPALATRQNYMFSGGYVQVAYTLTGENRSYDKRLGRLDAQYFGRRGPFSNAWVVRDENGRLDWSLGAVELAARYSYTNLNDGTGLSRIQGGAMNGFTMGLNWYWNDNVKCQFDWVYDRRYDMPTTGLPGYTSGLGMRIQFMF